MKTLIRGKIIDFVPSFIGSLGEGGTLVLGEDEGFSFTVDSGFNGGIALPDEILEKMEVEFFGYDTFTLATGDFVELPMYLGKVVVKGTEIETWIIPGDSLLGIEFLSSAGSALYLNFEDDTIELMR
ncbi:MAG: hypothetical protein ACE5IW_11725 [bacterium]